MKAHICKWSWIFFPPELSSVDKHQIRQISSTFNHLLLVSILFCTVIYRWWSGLWWLIWGHAYLDHLLKIRETRKYLFTARNFKKNMSFKPYKILPNKNWFTVFALQEVFNLFRTIIQQIIHYVKCLIIRNDLSLNFRRL